MIILHFFAQKNKSWIEQGPPAIFSMNRTKTDFSCSEELLKASKYCVVQNDVKSYEERHSSTNNKVLFVEENYFHKNPTLNSEAQ